MPLYFQKTFSLARQILFSNKFRSLIFLFVFIGLVYFQHRFWLFNIIYSDLYNKIGSGGDGYYNLSIYLQNNVNLMSGDFYSLDGDHYTWWSNIIGITAHGWAPSIVFWIFHQLTGSPTAAFNLLFFGNLMLIQLGIFLLLRHWTKNNWISMFGGLLVPLSQAFVTFYMAHIHASFYWWLPFMILCSEKLIDGQLNYKKIKFWCYFTFWLYCVYWFIFADWHSFVFGSIFLIPYFLYKFPKLVTYYKSSRRSVGIVTAGVVLIGLSSIRFVLGIFAASQTFNSTRDLGSVNGTNLGTESFLGIKYILAPIINGFISRFPSIEYKPQLEGVLAALQKADSMYPDTLSIFSFWIFVIIFVPWLILLIAKKSKFYPRLFTLMSISLLINIIIIGPYPKFGGTTFLNIYLPHQLIHMVFYPLQAIRAVWRGAFVGYLAVILFWGIVGSHLWNRLKLLLNSSFRLAFKRFFISTIFVILVSLSLIFMVIQNNGFNPRPIVAYTSDNDFNSLLDQVTNTNNKSKYDFYIWRSTKNSNANKTDSYHFNVSLRNYNKGYNQINWVVDGISGVYPTEASLLNSFHTNNRNLNLITELLDRKQVGLILQEKDTNPDSLAYESKSSELLSQNWNKTGENNSYALWQKKQQGTINNQFKLNYNFNISSLQSTETAANFGINIENQSNQVWVNPEPVRPVKFEIKTFSGDKVQKSITKMFGEPVFVLPNSGVPFGWTNNQKIYSKETNKIKLFREGVEVYSQDIAVKEPKEYQQVIDQQKNKDTKLDTNYTLPLPGEYGLNLIPVRIKAKVQTGLFSANPSTGKQIIAEYRIRSKSQPDSPWERYILPNYVGQPPCLSQENYLPGDTIDFWCLQVLPLFDTSGSDVKVIPILKVRD